MVFTKELAIKALGTGLLTSTTSTGIYLGFGSSRGEEKKIDENTSYEIKEHEGNWYLHLR